MIDPIIIVIALVAGLCVRQLGFPPMLGYLAAGFAISALGLYPSAGQAEGATTFIDHVASAGVTLLLFSIGLKLNLRDLTAIQVWGVGGIVMLVSMPVLALALMGLLALIPGLPQLEGSTLWTVAFALSFSSTVFAVKVFDERGEGAALHAKIAIGILIVQDLIAVVFLDLSTGKLPDWSALWLLLLIPLRPLIIRLFQLCGHGELLTLFGIGVAFGGYALFEYFQIKGDLGALILGVLLGGTGKTTELAKTLLNLKELFLVGFFLSIGLIGLPSVDMLWLAVGLAIVVVFKPLLYYGLFVSTRLRARTSLLASVSLFNYSEFGLIVAALASSTGLISPDWVVLIALALSLSFFVAVPFNARSHQLYRRWRGRLFERAERLDIELPAEIGDASVLVMGMGRVGRGAYTHLEEVYGGKVLGVEEAEQRLPVLASKGFKVARGDATDRDFWDAVNLPDIELILVSLTNHSENINVCDLLDDMGYRGKLAVVARFPDELEELTERGCIAFNLYAEAGYGFAEHVIGELKAASG